MEKNKENNFFQSRSNHTITNAMSEKNKTITNPSDIANTFTYYFTKVAIDIQSSIRFSKKNYF